MKSTKWVCALTAWSWLGCTAGPPGTPSREQGLRDLASRRGIGIGACADRLFKNDAEGLEFKAVLKREFNVLTPENDLKHERIHPSRDVYDFARGDSLLAFAEANGMQVRGHTLAWHNQLAPWLTSGTWTQAETKALLVEHINNVVGHYKGRIVAWDVVNEAVTDIGALRPSFYARNIGREYIELAFRTAHAADPSAQLFYNDYGIEGIGPKADSVHAMVKALRAAGVPIHGVGFQGHFRVGQLPEAESMVANLARFAELGLKVQFTEVDVRLSLPATLEQFEAQAEDYRTVFDVCTRTPACNMVVMWGVTDKDSWVPATFRGTGEALLFNRNYLPKLAYDSVRALLSGN